MESSVFGHVTEATASRGLRPMHAITSAGGDHSTIVQRMHETMAWPVKEYNDFSDVGGVIHMWHYRSQNPSERDWKEVRREPLPFNGEGDSDEHQLRPPFAWVTLWNGVYSNIHSFDKSLLYWGYVMWDKDRIDSTGAEKIIRDVVLDELPLGDLTYFVPEHDYDADSDDELEPIDDSDADADVDDELEPI
ncbi:hypothetical protein Trco_001941 [Trichoderma cornu-damae]|uniref:Uncharacterized protein n=1 Tax=Trichoderma cornu-damae TaxID=654480 RepID=A0A9P8QRV4_9HYPO|nr:hypothetical protein Trco_001941 [Trichoderma cornu-damae]